MNLSSPTQALQARAQPGGITPELIRLLAQMKVKQETDAAARDMAMKAGQQPPTVAEGLNAELEGNWRQKLEQKLGGLNALAQQQAPQGAPTMPGPPAQPTQHMARGGLAKLPSNLPQEYAGGGIVAFAKAGEVEIPRKEGEPDDEYEARKFMMEHPFLDSLSNMGKTLATPVTAAAKYLSRIPNWDSQGQQATSAAYQQQQETPADVAAQQGATQKRPAANTPPPPGPGAAPRARVSTGGNQAPAPEPQVSGLQAAYNTNTIKDINADPAMAGLIERTASKERRQAELGGDEAALRAARQQDYEQAKAAHEARMAKSAPSIWDRMSTLGKHAGYGQWGQAAGDQRTMELEHEARGASGLEALLKRKGEVDAMSLADKKAAFDFAEGRGTAAQAAAADSRKGALTSAGQLVGTQGTNATQLKIANIQAASARAAAKIVADRQDQVDKRSDITGLKSEIAAAEKSLAKYTPQVLMMLTPGTPQHEEAIQEMAWAKAVREANRARLAELTGVEYKAAPAAAVAVPAGTKVSKVAGT